MSEHFKFPTAPVPRLIYSIDTTGNAVQFSTGDKPTSLDDTRKAISADMLRYLGITRLIYDNIRMLCSASNINFSDVLKGNHPNKPAGKLRDCYVKINDLISNTLKNVLEMTELLYKSAGYGAHQAFVESIKIHEHYIEAIVNQSIMLSGAGSILELVKRGVTFNI